MFAETLADLIAYSVCNEKDEIAIAFSGGIDSALLAWILRSKKPGLYVVGVRDCHDFSSAEKAAKLMKLKLNKIIIDKKDVSEGIRDLLKVLKNPTVVSISYNLPLYFVAKYSKEKTILCGQGPDEMFGGYKFYEKLKGDELKKEIDKKISGLNTDDFENIGKLFGKKIRAPYINKQIIDFAFKLPVEYCIKNEKRKWILREAAKVLELPEGLIETPKKAAQYGSGIMSMMEKISKENKMNVGEWIEKIRKDS